MERKPRLDPAMVETFVGSAHGDLARVEALLAEVPALVNAAWDWGGGDWETALGAAAHMGRADIAAVLLAAGARMDVFAAAMLGRLDVVRAVLAVQPGALTAPGPHGISLRRHAEAGKAADVLAYLDGLSG